MNVSHTFPSNIFRAYDIRGKLSSLTPEVIQSIALALVEQYRQAGETQLVIGYDARLSSPIYAQIVQKVMEQHDIQVTNIGCCSSPMMYFIARSYAGNGIMITASHNPKTDNGLKWIIQAEPPSPEMIQQVGYRAQHYLAQMQPLTMINITDHEFKPEFCQSYHQALLNDISLGRPLKVVLDGLHGSAGRCAKAALDALGCEVIALRCDPNGEFPDHAPDPSHASHLQALRSQILQQQADIGIALDGDGDRLVIVDEHANIITADRLISLFAQMCLETHPQREIVYDVKCSRMVFDTVQRLNGKATMIRTGSSFLRAYIHQSQGQAVFGGEYAGHYVFNDGRGFGYDDGLYAALRVIEYFSHSTADCLSGLLAKYPSRYCTEDTYIDSHQYHPQRVLADIEVLSKPLNARLSKIDGVRLDFDDGFGIIRASNTGEYFTVRFDAETPTRLAEIRQQFVSILQQKYPNIADEISRID